MTRLAVLLLAMLLLPRQPRGGTHPGARCTQTDCVHADPGNHCMERSCSNYFRDCPRHG